ncbi:hypothetical protein FB451DRAFT_1213193 [Mycena latifolia]|nr:hypothetical protein FB451DRAFT_1213193 [Mycena latifolia]
MAPPEHELLPTGAEPDAFQPRAKRRSLRVVWILAGFALGLLAALAFTRTTSGETKVAEMISPPSAPEPHASQRVYLRVGSLGPEGFGSALQHFKQSIVFSRALDATLILASEHSEHQYSTSRIYNGHHDPMAFTIDGHNACRMKDRVQQARRMELVRGWCAGNEAAVAEIQRIKAEMQGCTGILDVDENETTEDLNGCIMDWVRERLAPEIPPLLPPPLSFPPERPVTVGVHIRWGDTAGKFGDGFRGSMPIPTIVRVLKDIRTEMGQHGVHLSVAMENADEDVLARLNETDYTVLDSGDAIADLHALSNNDFLLLGDSSWGVMVHLVAPHGLTIIEDNDQ